MPKPAAAEGAAPLTACGGRPDAGRSRRYDPGFAAGTVAAGGTLGILIPPSSIRVIHAVLAQELIITLCLAALVPALIAVLEPVVLIAVSVRKGRCDSDRSTPHAGPGPPTHRRSDRSVAPPDPRPPWVQVARPLLPPTWKSKLQEMGLTLTQ